MRIVTKNSGSAVANRIKLRISVDELNDVKNIGLSRFSRTMKSYIPSLFR
jgi:hypothetical protein